MSDLLYVCLFIPRDIPKKVSRTVKEHLLSILLWQVFLLAMKLSCVTEMLKET